MESGGCLHVFKKGNIALIVNHIPILILDDLISPKLWKVLSQATIYGGGFILDGFYYTVILNVITANCKLLLITLGHCLCIKQQCLCE
jgi:hypothetical protein